MTADAFAETQRAHGAGRPASGPLIVLPGGHRCDLQHVDDIAGIGTTIVPPHDLEAELGVLGSLLLLDESVRRGDDDRRATVLATLAPRDFYRPVHGEVFGVMAGMTESGRPIDVMLLREELLRRGLLEKTGGTGFISRIAASVPSAANAEHYARIVKDAADRRLLAGAAAVLQHAELTGDDEERARAGDRLDRARTEAGRATGLRSMTLADVEAADLPSPEAFVEDQLVVRQRLTLIVAAPKTGKSAGLLHLAKSVACGLGDTWLGSNFTGKRCPVVYLTAEGGLAMVKERSLLMPPKTDVRDLHVVAERPFPRLDSARGLAELSRLVRGTGAGLVIVDPLASFRSVADENDNAEAQRFAEGLLEFIAVHNAAMVIAHHPSRSSLTEGSTGTFGGGRGASALFAAADAEIALRREKGEIHATFSKRYGRPIEPGRRLCIDPATFTLEYVGDLGGSAHGPVGPDGVTPARAKTSIVDFENALQPVGSTHSKAAVVALLGVSDSTFRERVKGWGEHLGDRLDVGVEPGPHGQKTYRLKPLEERAAADGPA